MPGNREKAKCAFNDITCSEYSGLYFGFSLGHMLVTQMLTWFLVLPTANFVYCPVLCDNVPSEAEVTGAEEMALA